MWNRAAVFRGSGLFRCAQASRGPASLLLTLSSPAAAVFLRSRVESVSVPGEEGVFTLTNNHSQTVSRLGPGVVRVRLSPTEQKDFFLSGGFVVLSAPQDDSGCCHAEVSATELVPVEALDLERATQVLTELLATPRDSEWSNAKALLGQQLCSSVIKAASGALCK
eukprot:TRINITY_DN141483_c0_g1_i2.p1 TRINITY_DN141483_c0_g1~~TRINITY_DN141483_c0_g1_i2.p1  ORF type:complete len:166 (-),score=2.81 TRINITY_DN141483_c0_g1_i2:88-585(-)